MSVLRRLLTLAASDAVVLLGCAGLVVTAGCAESMQSARTDNSRLVRPESTSDVLSNQPPTPQTLLSMADILAAQGKDKECEFVLSNCIRQYPGFAPAYNGLAELQMRQGRVPEAASVLSGALQRWPTDPVLLNNVGMCFLVCRDYEKALEYFARVAACAPDSEKYRANMATSLGMLGRDAEAMALLKQVLPEEKAVHNAEVLRKAREKSLDGAAEKGP